MWDGGMEVFPRCQYYSNTEAYATNAEWTKKNSMHMVIMWIGDTSIGNKNKFFKNAKVMMWHVRWFRLDSWHRSIVLVQSQLRKFLFPPIILQKTAHCERKLRAFMCSTVLEYGPYGIHSNNLWFPYSDRCFESNESINFNCNPNKTYFRRFKNDGAP